MSLCCVRLNSCLSKPLSLFASPHFLVTPLYSLWSVIDGPDEPVLEARPDQTFYVSGDSLSLSCQAEGFPQPTAEWLFGGQNLSDSHEGVLNLNDVQSSQGGVYTCTLLNERTGMQQQRSMMLNVYGM